MKQRNSKVRRARKAQAKAMRGQVVSGPFYKKDYPTVIGRAPGVAKRLRAQHKQDLVLIKAIRASAARKEAA